MKIKKIIPAVVLGLLITAGYQVNAQMDGAMQHEGMAGHQCCKTMMGKDMGGMDDMGGMRQKMMNKMMGDHMGAVDLSPELQGEVDSIKVKYHDDLQAKEAVIDAKMTDLDKAWADESTTVGEINLIQGDLKALQKEYQQVKIKMNQEIGAKIGTTRMEDMQNMKSGSQRHMMHKGKCDGNCAGKGEGHGSMRHGSM